MRCSRYNVILAAGDDGSRMALLSDLALLNAKISSAARWQKSPGYNDEKQ